MKKNYNVPATEVVAFMGGAVLQSVSPTILNDPNIQAIDPGLGGNG